MVGLECPSPPYYPVEYPYYPVVGLECPHPCPHAPLHLEKDDLHARIACTACTAFPLLAVLAHTCREGRETQTPAELGTRP